MSAFDNASASFAGPRHNHRACVKTALDTAARLCAERGARLTPLRRRVLELIWRGQAPARHAPVRAYDLLARLSEMPGTARSRGTAKGRGTAGKRGTAKNKIADRVARPAAPPTVYRALEFLLAQGLIHRIESLNAYVGCMDPEGHTKDAQGDAHGSSHGGGKGGQFLICGDCGAAAEVHDPRIDAAVARRAEELGFAVRRAIIEIAGVCPPCQRRQASGQHRQASGQQRQESGRGR